MSTVDHPAHYGGADDPFEAIKVIEAWGLGFCLGNALEYIRRADAKGDSVENLEKARWYLDREIANRRSARDAGKPTRDSSAPASGGTAGPAAERSTASGVSARGGFTPNGNDEHDWFESWLRAGKAWRCAKCGSLAPFDATVLPPPGPCHGAPR